jgi:Zn-dependent protease with chaperone function
MTFAVYLPIARSGLLALGARPLATRLAPAAAGALAIVAAVVAASWYWMLALLFVCLADDLPHTPLLEQLPVPDGVSMVAGIALVWCTVRLTAAISRRRQLHRGLASVVAGGDGELVVVPGAPPHAFALSGRIVVSSTMLRALTAPQRRAMLAHERAHLSRRHGTVLMLVQLAAAVNPLLVPVRRAVGFLCERHADELAAAEVGDRYLVAEALAAAAMATSPPGPVGVPAFHRVGVVDRVVALVDPPRRYRSLGLITAGVIALVAFTSVCDATDSLYELVSRILPG